MHGSGEQRLFVDIFQWLVVVEYCHMPTKYVMVKLKAGMDDGEHLLLNLRIARLSISQGSGREGDRLVIL